MISRHLTAFCASPSLLHFQLTLGTSGVGDFAPIEVGGILFLCQLVSAMSFDGTQVCGVGKLARGWAMQNEKC